MPPDRFTTDKAPIRDELERLAPLRLTITYGEVGHLVRQPASRLGAILAAIRAEEAERGRPDLTALAVMMSTGLPTGMSRDRAIAVQEAVFAVWADQRT